MNEFFLPLTEKPHFLENAASPCRTTHAARKLAPSPFRPCHSCRANFTPTSNSSGGARNFHFPRSAATPSSSARLSHTEPEMEDGGV